MNEAAVTDVGSQALRAIGAIRAEVAKALIGQRAIIDEVLIALLAVSSQVCASAGRIIEVLRQAVRLSEITRIVSPNGLVLTNHHVARGQLQKMSSKQKDYVADGFYARTQKEEMKCPDLELRGDLGQLGHDAALD